MSLLKIFKYGEAVLQRPSESVTNINGELQKLVSNMIETMYAAPGLGLAAPQVGIGKRLAVIDTSVGEEKSKLIVIINPEIRQVEGEQVGEEGCLSIPDVYANVARPKRVFVTGVDVKGNPVEYEAKDLEARAFCHEVDHLNGKLIMEFLSPIKREFAKRKIRKKVLAGEW